MYYEHVFSNPFFTWEMYQVICDKDKQYNYLVSRNTM